MTTRKLGLLFAAVASCFFMNAQAQPPVTVCQFCVYDHNTNVAIDPNSGACTEIYQSPNQPGGGPLNTPFSGDNGFTVNSFRSVGFQDCDYCTLTAFANADLTGKSAIISGTGGGYTDNIGGTVKYGNVGFCAKSLYVYCDASSSRPEEEEEEGWEEEEEEGGQQQI